MTTPSPFTPSSAAPLPFQPIRSTVYGPAELFAGFDPEHPGSYGDTMDFRSYRWFVQTGRSTPVDPYAAMMRALHDSSVTYDAGSVIDGHRVVGIMGGHQLPRTSDEYAAVADLGRRLARLGMLVCTGGGPGAMEAAHIGAATSQHPESVLRETIAGLAVAPRMPELHGILNSKGEPDPALVRAAGEWFAPAWVAARALEDPVESLSIPTWLYGHEPTTPFATRIAKLFQNSVREDGLITIARQGLVFTQGSAGTLQEVFQDANQNFYAQDPDWFSPMVFLGTDYWGRILPVRPLLDSLFATADSRVRETARRLVLVTDDIDEAVEHLDRFDATPSRLAR